MGSNDESFSKPVRLLSATLLTLDDAKSALPGTWLGSQAYTLRGESGGKPETLVLVPFADSKSSRVWLKKPPTLQGERQ
jgi:hypothetical protein